MKRTHRIDQLELWSTAKSIDGKIHKSVVVFNSENLNVTKMKEKMSCINPKEIIAENVSYIPLTLDTLDESQIGPESHVRIIPSQEFTQIKIFHFPSSKGVDKSFYNGWYISTTNRLEFATLKSDSAVNHMDELANCLLGTISKYGKVFLDKYPTLRFSYQEWLQHYGSKAIPSSESILKAFLMDLDTSFSYTFHITRKQEYPILFPERKMWLAGITLKKIGKFIIDMDSLECINLCQYLLNDQPRMQESTPMHDFEPSDIFLTLNKICDASCILGKEIPQALADVCWRTYTGLLINNQYRIFHPTYSQLFYLRGNDPNLERRFIACMVDEKETALYKAFPFYQDLFDDVETDLNKMIGKLLFLHELIRDARKYNKTVILPIFLNNIEKILCTKLKRNAKDKDVLQVLLTNVSPSHIYRLLSKECDSIEDAIVTIEVQLELDNTESSCDELSIQEEDSSSSESLSDSESENSKDSE